MEWRGCERKIFHQPSFSVLPPDSSSRRFPRRVENPGRPGPEHLGGDGGGAAAGLSVACPQADVGTRGKNRQTRKIQISPRFGPFSALTPDRFGSEMVLYFRHGGTNRFAQIAGLYLVIFQIVQGASLLVCRPSGGRCPMPLRFETALASKMLAFSCEHKDVCLDGMSKEIS